MARCILDSRPVGCRGGWEGLLPRTVEKLEVEVRGRYCLVKRPLKAVLRSDACKELMSIAEGRAVNLLLLGPPGTGKSLFMDIVERVAPHTIYRAEPESMLSHYVGETERRFRQLLDSAEASAPSIILFDEADYLIKKREFGGKENGYSEIRENLVRMLLRRMQEWRNRGAEVYIIASSNMPLAAVDTALVRAHRFRTLFFPVPDTEAVKLVFELYGKTPPSDEEIAEALMKAPSYANIVEWVRTGRLTEFQLSPFMKLLSVSVKASCRLEKRRVYLVAEEHPLAAAVAAVHAAIAYRKPLILLLEPIRYEDAVWLSRSLDWPLAVPYSSLVAENVYSIIYRSRVVYLLGSEWNINAKTVSLRSLSMECGEAVVKKGLGCRKMSLEDCLYDLIEDSV